MNKKRIIKWVDGQPTTPKRYVLYWMQQSQRVVDNHALSFAIGLANKYQLPLVVFFGLTPSYPSANLRHYAFMLEGLADTRLQLIAKGARFIFRIGSPEKAIQPLLHEAHCLVMDTGYMRHQVAWRTSLVSLSKVDHPDLTIWQVESDVIVPARLASTKTEYGAYTLRPKIHKLMDEFIDEVPDLMVQIKDNQLSLIEDQWASFDEILPYLAINKNIQPTPYFKSGPTEALRRLNEFITYHLHHYLESDDPSRQWTSSLSPYLHFGQLAPLTLVKAAEQAVKDGLASEEAADAFIEQVVVRRELAINFVTYNEGYDRFDKMTEPWAYQTMQDHSKDPRPHLYTMEDYLQFRTVDPYFNAAMKEMVFTGYMHNYMRMYWAKKIIEWSSSYEEAYRIIVTLNDTYFLDGRDPNSYASIAWVFGKHDRPWIERSIFGKLRYMNDKGLERKFDIQSYVEQMNRLN